MEELENEELNRELCALAVNDIFESWSPETVGFLTICFMTRECLSSLFHCISVGGWHSKQARPMWFKRVFVGFPRKELTARIFTTEAKRTLLRHC